MKVSIAVIKLVLRTNKVLSDGSSPIMLRCSFNGMKERSTGYSCTVRYWDKKNECVKKGFPNFVMVNSELKKQKDEAIRKRDEYIANDEVYTPEMILCKEEVRNAVTNDFRGLIQRYIDEKGLEDRTIEKWHIVERNVLLFCGRKTLLVNEINEAFCRNVENDDNIPLIDLDCRYYSYRHSYIMKEIQKPTVNLLALAQTVGKSSHTLHQYISLLGDVDLV